MSIGRARVNGHVFACLGGSLIDLLGLLDVSGAASAPRHDDRDEGESDMRRAIRIGMLTTPLSTKWDLGELHLKDPGQLFEQSIAI